MKPNFFKQIFVFFIIIGCCLANNQNNNKIFSKENYYSGNDYQIYPTELKKIDLERPIENSNWQKSLYILYPQIYNLKDKESQIKINKLIYDKVLATHNILNEEDYTNYSLTYEIMECDSNTISILFWGEIDDFNTSNNFSYSITVDMSNGEIMELKDFYNTDTTSIKSFTLVSDNLEKESDKNLYIKNFIKNYKLNRHFHDFYIKGNKIGVIIPTFNSMGYIIIEGDIK